MTIALWGFAMVAWGYALGYFVWQVVEALHERRDPLDPYWPIILEEGVEWDRA